MLGLDDWIVESKFIRTAFGREPEFAVFAAKATRSGPETEQGMARLEVFSAFAWKV